MSTRKYGYLRAQSYQELVNRHCFLFQSKPVYECMSGFLPQINEFITCYHIRFPFDYKNIRKKLKYYFERYIFPEAGNGLLEVQIGFNAVLYNKERNEFDIFYAPDFSEREKEYIGINHRVKFMENNFQVTKSQDISSLPVSFQHDLPEIMTRLSMFFESSGVEVIDIINVVYIIRQIGK